MKRLVSLLFLLPLALLLLSSSASAGSYYYIQCPSGAATSVDATRIQSAGAGNLVHNPQSGFDCFASGGRYWLGVQREAGTEPSNGAFLGWRFSAPEDTLIEEVSGRLSSCRVHSSSNNSVLPQFLTASNQVLAPVAFNSYSFTTASSSNQDPCPSSSSSPDWREASTFFNWDGSGSNYRGSVANLSPTSAIDMRLRCGNSECRTTAGQYIRAADLRFRIRDNTPPTNSITLSYLEKNPLGIPVTALTNENNDQINYSSRDSGGGVESSLLIANPEKGFTYALFGVLNSKACSVQRTWSAQYSESYPTKKSPCPDYLGGSLQEDSYTGFPWVLGKNSLHALSADYANDGFSGNSPATSTKSDLIVDGTPPASTDLCFGLGSASATGWYDSAGNNICLLLVADLNQDEAGNFLPQQEVAGLREGWSYATSWRQTSNISYFDQIRLSRSDYYWPLNSPSLESALGGNALSPDSWSEATYNSSVYSPPSGRSWNFNGGTGLSGPSLPRSDSTSVSLWVRPEGTAAKQTLVHQHTICWGCIGSPSKTPFHLGLEDQKIVFSGDAGNTPWKCSSDTAIPRYKWSFITATRQAQTAESSGSIKIYIDGVLARSCTSSAGVDTNTAAQRINIGSLAGISIDPYKGKMAHISITRGDIPESVVNQIYTYGCSSPYSPCEIPVSTLGEGDTKTTLGASLYSPAEGETDIVLSAVDRVGNFSRDVVSSIKVDSGQPAMSSIQCDGTAGENNWYTSDLSCSFQGADNGSRPQSWSASRLSSNSSPAIVKSSRTNLVANARGYAGTFAWSGSGWGSPETLYNSGFGINSRAPDGSEVQSLFSLNISPGQGVYTSFDYSPGAYLCSAWIHARPGADSGALRLVFADSQGNVLSRGDWVSPASSWKKAYVTHSFSSTGSARCLLESQLLSRSFFSNVLLEKTSQTNVPFFDGFSSGASWSGDPARSASTLPNSGASGGITVFEEGEANLRVELADGADKKTSREIFLAIDKTAPTTEPWECPSANSRGWYTADITCTARGSDNISRVRSLSTEIGENDSYAEKSNSLDGSSASTQRTGSVLLNQEGSFRLRSSFTNGAGLDSPWLESSLLRLDKTAPETSLWSCPEPPASGWFTANFTCNLQGDDNISAVESLSTQMRRFAGSSYQNISNTLAGDSSSISRTGEALVDQEGDEILLRARFTNGAGLQSSWRYSYINYNDYVPLRLDKTAPTNLAWSCGNPNSRGWYTSDIICSIRGQENVSRIESLKTEVDINSSGYDNIAHSLGNWSGPTISRSGEVALSAESSSLRLRGSFTNGAGLESSWQESSLMRLDKTPPSTNSWSCTEANAYGWHKQDVQCQLSGSDNISDISSAQTDLSLNNGPYSESLSPTLSAPGASRTATVSVSREGSDIKLRGSFMNGAGLDAAPVYSPDIKIDKTAPTDQTVLPGNNYFSARNGYTLNPRGSDALSGIDPASVQCQRDEGDGVWSEAMDCIDLPVVSDQQRLRYRISDRAGNTIEQTSDGQSLVGGWSAPINPQIDENPPSDLLITSSTTSWSRTSVALDFLGQDTNAADGAGLERIELESVSYPGTDIENSTDVSDMSPDMLRGGTPWVYWCQNSERCTTRLVLRDQGSRQMRFRLYDQAGGFITRLVVVRIDRTDPVITRGVESSSSVWSAVSELSLRAQEENIVLDNGRTQPGSGELRAAFQWCAYPQGCTASAWRTLEAQDSFSSPPGCSAGVVGVGNLFSCALNSQRYANGTYLVRGRISDAAGNRSFSPSRGEDLDSGNYLSVETNNAAVCPI